MTGQMKGALISRCVVWLLILRAQIWKTWQSRAILVPADKVSIPRRGDDTHNLSVEYLIPTLEYLGEQFPYRRIHVLH